MSPSTITSAANDSAKYVRGLQRRRKRYQEQVFVAEGLRTIEEAIKAGCTPASLFVTAEALEQSRMELLVSRTRQLGAQVRVVTETVMSAMSDAVTPAGILAVLPMAKFPIPQSLNWVLVLDQLRDPGNMGTILRSALAAGVDLVITSQETVDPYSPKVVRAAMGAHFRLRLCLDRTWEDIDAILAGLRILVARPGDGTAYWEIDWQLPTALVIGGEAEGAGAEAERRAAGYVTIPLSGPVESLNAGVAAGVLLMEAARQRLGCGC